MFKLTPATKDYIWGGTKLKSLYKKNADTPIIAEAWELSCHKNGESLLPDGTPLSSFLSENPAAAGTACGKFNQFPLLVKLIDAADKLSVQVHPDNSYALKHEGQLGKTEMWYVLDAEKDAFLYYGFKKVITKSEFEHAISGGTLCELLNKVPVKKGDMFFIKAGTIHAIGEGIVIAEIQQSSDVTYRVYDYNRKGADGNERELHIAKALDVTSLEPADSNSSFNGHLAKCEYFTVDRIGLTGEYKFNVNEQSFKAVLITSGSALACCNDGEEKLNMGETLFITAKSGEVVLKGIGEALIIYVE